MNPERIAMAREEWRAARFLPSVLHDYMDENIKLVQSQLETCDPSDLVSLQNQLSLLRRLQVKMDRLDLTL